MDSSALLTLQAAQAQTAIQGQSKALSAMGGTPNKKLGQDFESMCLSNLLSPMFEGLSTDGPFGGGQGEASMRSFLIDAMAKGMTQRGGLGISDMMQKQLLQMQEAG